MICVAKKVDQYRVLKKEYKKVKRIATSKAKPENQDVV